MFKNVVNGQESDGLIAYDLAFQMELGGRFQTQVFHLENRIICHQVIKFLACFECFN